MSAHLIRNDMPSTTNARFTVNNVHLARAIFAAIAALMITFSPDHSAEVGLSTFGGFAIATGLVFALSVWLVYPAGRRTIPSFMAFLFVAAGLAASVPTWRSTILFFVLVISWAAVTGLIELLWGIVQKRAGHGRVATDAIIVGAFTILLAVLIALVSPDYAGEFAIPEADVHGYVTGITIAVGYLGGYAAIIAVFLGIGAFPPKGQKDSEETGTIEGEENSSTPTDDTAPEVTQ